MRCLISYRCHRRLASWLVVKGDDLSLGQRSYLIPLSLYLSATAHTYTHTSAAAPSGVLSLQPIFGWIFWLRWCYWDPSVFLQQKHSKRHLRTDALCRERTSWHVRFCLHDFQTGGFRVVSSWRGDPAGVVSDVSRPRLADVKGAFLHRHSAASRHAQGAGSSLPRVPEENETDESQSTENITLGRTANRPARFRLVMAMLWCFSAIPVANIILYYIKQNTAYFLTSRWLLGHGLRHSSGQPWSPWWRADPRGPSKQRFDLIKRMQFITKSHCGLIRTNIIIQSSV